MIDNYPVCDVCDALMDSSSSSLTCHRCMAMRIPPPLLRGFKQAEAERLDHEDDVRPDHEDGRNRTDDNLRSVFG